MSKIVHFSKKGKHYFCFLLSGRFGASSISIRAKYNPTCGAANAGPLSPTRLAPHSWRADPWSSNWVSLALEKDRGFVHGAIGIVEIVLCDTPHTCVFTVRLTSGSMVVVHPHSNWRPVYLPCAYGYATTIRRAQGSSLDQQCLFFDHSHPPVGATKRKLMQWKQIY